jgi:hypothetical protein
MTPPASVPVLRRVLASASLGAASVGMGVMAARDFRFGGWEILGVAGLVAAGAVGLARRGIVAQVLSRAVAWVVLTPMFFGIVEALYYRRSPDGAALFFAATSAGALLLARPALHTESARAEFAPAAHRRLFLAGAVASVMTGLVVAMSAAAVMSWSTALLGTALVAAGVGVARMRSWGVLLGLATSVAAVGAASFASHELIAIGLLLAAMPGALLGATVLGARLRSPRVAPVVDPTRIADRSTVLPPARTRVALDELDETDDDESERKTLVPQVRISASAGGG